MEKKHLDRRLDQMRREGTVFRAGVDVGDDDLTADRLRDRYDAVVLAMGATEARDLPIPGRELGGIHQAMDFLPQANRVALGEEVADQVTATGKNVVIIGGGDTGRGLPRHVDPPGCGLRSRSWRSCPSRPRPGPPASRGRRTRWRSGSPRRTRRRGERGLLGLHQGVPRRRGRQRARAAPGRRRLRGRQVRGGRGLRAGDPGRAGAASRWASPARRSRAWSSSSGSTSTSAATWRAARTTRPRSPGVFVAGDAGRGQSLIVWAIAEGRAAAAAVDAFLTGSTTLPVPDRAHRAPPRRSEPPRRRRDLRTDVSRRSSADRRFRRATGCWNVPNVARVAGVRRAKIVCTLGPADDARERRIRELVYAGMDVARLNMSHGTHEDHARGLPPGAGGLGRQRPRRRHLRRPPGPEDPAGDVRRRPGRAEPRPGVDDHHPRRRRRRTRSAARRTRACPATSARRPDPASTTARSGCGSPGSRTAPTW